MSISAHETSKAYIIQIQKITSSYSTLRIKETSCERESENYPAVSLRKLTNLN